MPIQDIRETEWVSIGIAPLKATPSGGAVRFYVGQSPPALGFSGASFSSGVPFIVPAGGKVYALAASSASTRVLIEPYATPSGLVETWVARMRRGYELRRRNNPHVNLVMASPPTVTLGAVQPAGNPQRVAVVSNPEKFYFTGGDPLVYSSSSYRFPVTTIQNGGVNGNTSNGRNAVGWRTKLIIDAIAPDFRVVNSTANIRFIVDGQYISMAGVVPANAGFNNWITLDFTAVGGRARREIWIEGDYANALHSVGVGPTETVGPAPKGFRMTIFGDSLTASTSSGVTVANLNDGFPQVLGDCFGVADLRLSGSGGEGFLAGANSGAAYTLRQRLEWDAKPSDAFGIFMGSNDAAFSASALTAEVIATAGQLRAMYPNAPVFVAGAPGNSSGPSAGTLVIENAYAAGVAALGDPNVIFIPVSTASPPMLFGTGKHGAENNTGNSDKYVGDDGTHPTADGHQYQGLWYADGIYHAIQSLP